LGEGKEIDLTGRDSRCQKTTCRAGTFRVDGFFGVEKIHQQRDQKKAAEDDKEKRASIFSTHFWDHTKTSPEEKSSP